jgi:hypothetical protein
MLIDEIEPVEPLPPAWWSAWRIPTVQLPSKRKKLRSPSRRAAMGALAVTVGLTAGAFALYWWRCKKQREAETPCKPSAGRAPRTTVLWVPQTREGVEDLLKTARVFVKMTNNLDATRRLVWAWHWRSVPYPVTEHPGDHPSLRQAKELVRTVVDAAWAEPPAPRATAAPQEAALATETVVSSPAVESRTPVSGKPSLADMTSEVPTPGYFYRVRAEDKLRGEDGVAARAVHAAALVAARAKGWLPSKAEARARRFAGKARIHEAYAEIIAESEWSARCVEPLVEGALLWLPPLRQFSLMDRSRQRPFSLETRPWPDGSSKLAPPPWLREVLAESGVLGVPGGGPGVMHR